MMLRVFGTLKLSMRTCLKNRAEMLTSDMANAKAYTVFSVNATHLGHHILTQHLLFFQALC